MLSKTPVDFSLRESLRSAAPEEVEKIVSSLPAKEALRLLYDWTLWARDSQLSPEGIWDTWLILAGRGFGKTRTGAEQVRSWHDQGFNRIALVGQTPAEVREVMIEGESGILAISPPWDMPHFEPSKRKLTWPDGSFATTYSAENPELLRGPQHEKAWVDELAKFRYLEDTWNNLMLGLRIGSHPQCVITTTPRPSKILRDILSDNRTVITRGSTFDNSRNLSEAFLKRVVEKYEGTRLGRQELHAEILDDNPGALWKRDTIERSRVLKAGQMRRIVVSIDPAVTSTADSDETGIVVAGIDENGHGYVLEDISMRASPDAWAKASVTAYHRWSADRIVGESNNGGDMIEQIIRTVDRSVAYKKVWASRGKQTRAEPIAALYEQGKVHHVGYFPTLEDEYCEWEPGMDSPNHLDAAVWAFTELMLGSGGTIRVLDKRRIGL